MSSDATPTMSQLARELAADEQQIMLGGGQQAIERQRAKKRLFVRDRLKLHIGQNMFDVFGKVYAPMVEMACILIVLWLVSFWMYRRKIFLRI